MILIGSRHEKQQTIRYGYDREYRADHEKAGAFSPLYRVSRQQESLYMVDQPSPLVSVIVPVYHVEKELRRCLDSLLRQSFRDFEILLINDGGSAEETAICEEYAASDPRIVYQYQRNQGLSAARNTGLSLARGTWIMFADSDDWVSEDFIEKALAAVKSDDIRMVIFDLAYMTPGSEEIAPHRSAPETGVYDSDFILRKRLTGGIVCYAWNKLYSRTLWEGISFPYGELWEDDAIIHELIDRCDKIAVIHDILYYKMNRPESITGIAARNHKQYYWVFVQRRRRFFYLREHHPEMMAVENPVMTASAVQYAASSALRGDKDEIQKISRWLRQLNLPDKSWNRTLRIKNGLLKYSPGLFSAAARLFHHLKPPAAGSAF